MNKKLPAGIGLALLVCACVSTPKPNAALESARTVVRTAEADPNVTKYAALDLDAAKKDLEVAESAALHHDDAAVDHPAYLAAQTGRLAQFRASAKADDARVAAGQAERDQIRLAARAREVDKARAAADQAASARDQAAAARDQAAEKAARLQAEVDALKAKPTDRGLVLTLGDVLFDTGKADLNPGATRKLDQLAQFLADHPDRRLQIDGFTDSVGTDSYNLDLSQRRANAVKSALQVRGIDATRITTQGYGKEFAVASNADSGGRQLNRRVEVVIGGENGAAVEARGRR
jgi:outer membrane protein OmpA-like peptidoglycan-associated protein